MSGPVCNTAVTVSSSIFVALCITTTQCDAAERRVTNDVETVGGNAPDASTIREVKDPIFYSIKFAAEPGNEFVGLEATMTVPERLNPFGTLFVWPGLQPYSKEGPIGNGVLQSVLTYGPSCAPGAKPDPYTQWWVSGMYVNVTTHLPRYKDCHGGDVMTVAPGNVLKVKYQLIGKHWIQTVVNLTTRAAVDFDIDLDGQAQGYAEFELETWASAPFFKYEFRDVKLFYRHASHAGCSTATKGYDDQIIGAHAIQDGKACVFDALIVSFARDWKRTSQVAAATPLYRCDKENSLVPSTDGIDEHFFIHNYTNYRLSVYRPSRQGRVLSSSIVPGGSDIIFGEIGCEYIIENEDHKCIGIYKFKRKSDNVVIKDAY